MMGPALPDNVETIPPGGGIEGTEAVEIAAAALGYEMSLGYWTAVRLDAGWRVIRFQNEADALSGVNPSDWCLVSDQGTAFVDPAGSLSG